MDWIAFAWLVVIPLLAVVAIGLRATEGHRNQKRLDANWSRMHHTDGSRRRPETTVTGREDA